MKILIMFVTSALSSVVFAVALKNDISTLPALSKDGFPNFSDFTIDPTSIKLDSSENGSFEVEIRSNFSSDVEFFFLVQPENSVELLPSSFVVPPSGNVKQIINVIPHNIGISFAVLNSSTLHVNPISRTVQINVFHAHWIEIFSLVVGWIYFFAWAISYYPQIYMNFSKKSVAGLSLDFVSLNTVGFLCYFFFNVFLYAHPKIQEQYFIDHPFGINPVKLNDVIFSLWGAIACLIMVMQSLIYDRGDQRISLPCTIILIVIGIFVVISSIIAGVGTIMWLEFLYWLSYVKLFITFIKYVPQAYLNFRRKSTEGWSIANVLLDFTGGAFSILQMILLSYNNNDWNSIFGDPTKFGLGVFSIAFDILFMVQHFIIYRKPSYEEWPDCVG